MLSDSSALALGIDRFGPSLLFDHNGFEPVSRLIADAFAGTRVALFVHQRAPAETRYFAFANYPESFVESFQSHYAPLNVWARGFNLVQPHVAVPAERFCPRHEFQETEFFKGWVEPLGAADDGFAVGIAGDETVTAAILANHCSSLGRGRRSRMMDGMTQVSRRIARHLDVRQITAVQDAARKGLIDQSRKATWILARDGRIVGCNAAAEALLTAGTLFRRDSSDRLECLEPKAATQIATAFRHLAEAQAAAMLPVVRFQRRGETADCLIVFTEAPSKLDLGPLSPLIPSRIIAVLVEPGMKPTGIAPQRIASVFNLTRLEAEAAAAIAAGRTIIEYAEARGVSHLTVRNQLRSAMEKMGVSRQVELVAIVQRM
jgi:DNA-binding CsgD family transcriptional regulator